MKNYFMGEVMQFHWGEGGGGDDDLATKNQQGLKYICFCFS